MSTFKLLTLKKVNNEWYQLGYNTVGHVIFQLFVFDTGTGNMTLCLSSFQLLEISKLI